MSFGVIEPSDIGVPALTKSFSWTKIWLDNLIRYFLISPVLASIIISLLPLLILPNDTTPSISLTIAGFEGFLASNNSVTLGRPPVISPVLADFLGILTNILPRSILSPSLTTRWAPTGKLYDLIISSFEFLTSNVGIIFLFLDSMITFSWNPVCSSISTS